MDCHDEALGNPVYQTCTQVQHWSQEKNSSHFEEICAQISSPTDPNPAQNGVGFLCSGSAVHALFDQISFSLYKET